MEGEVDDLCKALRKHNLSRAKDVLVGAIAPGNRRLFPVMISP